MSRLKTFAVAGALAFASLGMGSAVASAAPAVEPPVPTVQGTSQADDQAPSPYAAYGGKSICATAGLYFVNICV
jgi:hypothetical protein